MKDFISDIKRQTELLARVMNGESVDKLDFSEENNVALITIERDLKYLRSQGIMIYSRKGKVVLEEEINKTILNKLTADYLPLKLNSDVFLKQVRSISKTRQKNYFQYLVLIAKSVDEGRFIRIKYNRLSDNQDKEYLLKPVRLFAEEHNWILNAVKEGEEKVKRFFISRIKSLTLIDKKFKLMPIEKKERKYEIILKFNKEVEEEIYDKVWFDDFEIVKTEEDIILKTNQPLTNKLASWCISWYDMIEIVGPTDLIEYIDDMIESFKKRN